MEKTQYLVYVNSCLYDYFFTLKEAEEFVSNFKYRYPKALCYIEFMELIE